MGPFRRVTVFKPSTEGICQPLGNLSLPFGTPSKIGELSGIGAAVAERIFERNLPDPPLKVGDLYGSHKDTKYLGQSREVCNIAYEVRS